MGRPLIRSHIDIICVIKLQFFTFHHITSVANQLLPQQLISSRSFIH